MSPLFSIESRIAGIPCIIRVDTCIVVPPFRDSPHNCDSSDDYYGYRDVEFTVLDRKGYKAAWLERKMTVADKNRIEQEILDYTH